MAAGLDDVRRIALQLPRAYEAVVRDSVKFRVGSIVFAAVSPDESLLYINDTPKAWIKVYDVGSDGTLSNGRMFFEGIGSGVIEEGIPDGMKCDKQGNIWVTGPAGVWVISAGGEHLGTVKIPENVGNLTWGGPDWHTLFVPSSTSLYAFETKVGPRREPYMS